MGGLDAVPGERGGREQQDVAGLGQPPIRHREALASGYAEGDGAAIDGSPPAVESDDHGAGVAGAVGMDAHGLAGREMPGVEVERPVEGAANGDAANKIGTYTKAVLAKENGIPFYVAAPSSTIDLKCKTGADIPIEERDEDEVHYVGRERITPVGARAGNPAFDVTPAKYITGIITERGIIKPNQLKKVFST